MTASSPRPGPPAPGPGRALGHVVLAGVLGAVVAVAGAPVLLAALFGGPLGVLVGAVVVMGLASALAFALDRAAGPGATGRPGSGARGFVVGGLGSAAGMGIALLGLHADVGDDLPVPLRYAAVALPFAALAALQWPGVVRIATAALLVTGGAAVVVPTAIGAADQRLTDRIVTEVGTTEKPWVTEVDGYRLSDTQATGSPFIWTELEPVDGGAGNELLLFRDAAVDPAESDPCAQFSFYTPEGDNPMTSCTRVADRLWLRTTDGWQELARYDADVRIGVAARPGAPLDTLVAAVAAARPMTDAEYDTWLDEGLTPGW